MNINADKLLYLDYKLGVVITPLGDELLNDNFSISAEMSNGFGEKITKAVTTFANTLSKYLVKIRTWFVNLFGKDSKTLDKTNKAEAEAKKAIENNTDKGEKSVSHDISNEYTRSLKDNANMLNTLGNTVDVINDITKKEADKLRTISGSSGQSRLSLINNMMSSGVSRGMSIINEAASKVGLKITHKPKSPLSSNGKADGEKLPKRPTKNSNDKIKKNINKSNEEDTSGGYVEIKYVQPSKDKKKKQKHKEHMLTAQAALDLVNRLSSDNRKLTKLANSNTLRNDISKTQTKISKYISRAKNDKQVASYYGGLSRRLNAVNSAMLAQISVNLKIQKNNINIINNVTKAFG